MLPKRPDTKANELISNCNSFLVRLSKSAKLLVFIGNPLEEEATVTGNYTQQVTHTFFFHLNLGLCLTIPKICASCHDSWALIFLLQIPSLVIFSITFVHVSANTYSTLWLVFHTHRSSSEYKEWGPEFFAVVLFGYSYTAPPPPISWDSVNGSTPSLFLCLSILPTVCSYCTMYNVRQKKDWHLSFICSVTQIRARPMWLLPNHSSYCFRFACTQYVGAGV